MGRSNRVGRDLLHCTSIISYIRLSSGLVTQGPAPRGAAMTKFLTFSDADKLSIRPGCLPLESVASPSENTEFLPP